MRQTRSIRNRRQRNKREVMELDITSLLDILVIILVFLLKSYNSSGILFNVPKGIILPQSSSQSNNTPGVVVQVSETKIWVDDDLVLDRENPTGKIYDRGDRRIIPLYNALVEKRRTIQQVEKTSPNAKKFSGVVNLIIDKTVKYNEIKKLMYTAAEAQYQRYKFVVMGTESY